jgi:transcriptional regulator with XRE-family HTH domain
MDDHYDNEFVFEPNPLEDIEAMSLPLDRLFVMVRDRLGLLQKDMADLMGITRSTLSDIENGKTPNPNAETLRAFQQAVAQAGASISDGAIARAKRLSKLPFRGERDPFFIDFETWYVTLSDPDKRQVRIYLDSLRNLIEHFSGRTIR